MLRIVSCDNESYKNKLRKYLENTVLRSQKISNSVRKIIMDVKEGGDKSLLKLTNKYENNIWIIKKKRYECFFKDG